jgi:hypothetical protein
MCDRAIDCLSEGNKKASVGLGDSRSAGNGSFEELGGCDEIWASVNKSPTINKSHDVIGFIPPCPLFKLPAF